MLEMADSDAQARYGKIYAPPGVCDTMAGKPMQENGHAAMPLV